MGEESIARPNMTSHNRNLLAGLCALSVLASGAAAAETYLDVSLSMVMPSNETVRGVPRAPGTSGPIDLTTDSGFGATVAWGAQHANGRMTELEFGYRRTKTDAFETTDGSPLIWERGNPSNWEASAPAVGDTSTTSLMVNHYGMFGEGAARPYLGAGIGVALHAFDVKTVGNLLQRGEIAGSALTDETTVFAWQVMAGVRYRGFRLGYRYFQTGDTEVDGLEVTYGRHAVEVGMRF